MYGAEYVNCEELSFKESRNKAICGDRLQNVGIYGCKFKNLGSKAIYITESQNCEVISCDITDMGRGGIVLGGGDKVTLTNGNNKVENCHISNFQTQCRTYCTAIHLEGVGNSALHNQINDAPHMAISVSGNYNDVSYNEMYNLLYDTMDCGAIYYAKTFADQGNIVNYNFIHDFIKGKGETNERMGIYMDDHMAGTQINGNLIVDVDVAMLMHGGREHEIKNNLVIDCVKGITLIDWWYDYQLDDADSVLWQSIELSPYKNEIWKERFPRLGLIRNELPKDAMYNTVKIMYQSIARIWAQTQAINIRIKQYIKIFTKTILTVKMHHIALMLKIMILRLMKIHNFLKVMLV